MKKLFFLTAISFTFCNYSSGQIICIFCYDQNDSISSGVNNLLLNGSFETNTCNPNNNASTFCPNAFSYSCDVANWTCTGGGAGTYCGIWTNAITTVVDGIDAVYFGNEYCLACSSASSDTSCIINVDCTVADLPPGYPISGPSFGGAGGLSIAQTVTGLTIGHVYVLEFWAGGENFGSFPNKGLFALDVGFGDTMLRCKPTMPGATGSVYIIEFIATSSSHTIKFHNWGHICSDCTELILDRVRLYTLAELSASVPACSALSPGSFAASDTILCEKFCINFFDSSTNYPTAWQWIFPGGTPASSTNQNPTNICYTVPGIYDVTLITSTANGNDTLTLPGYITVNPTPPFPTITQVGYTLTSSASSSYQWQFNATDIPGATNQSYTILQTGYYTVVVGDSNGCKNSFTTYVLIDGIGDVNGDAEISIYPNPVTDGLMVEFSYAKASENGWLHGHIGEEISLCILNAVGQKIFSSSEKIGTVDWRKEIDLHDAVSGVYFIEIKSQNIFVKKKIIITKYP